MTHNSSFCNKPNLHNELSNIPDQEKLETPLEIALEAVLDKSKEVLGVVEETQVNRWMEIASPILKSGGKTVAIILSLGFIAFPLAVFGNPVIGIILATGATITAISSSLK